MTERKMMTVSIQTKDENHSWVVGRIAGMMSAIANGGNSFYTNEGYAVIHKKLPDGETEYYQLFADVSLEEFATIFTMLQRSYGDEKLVEYIIKCDW